MRRAAVALVLALTMTGAGYVRRAWLPPRTAVVTVVGGSRDRTLAGKARRRARRAR